MRYLCIVSVLPAVDGGQRAPSMGKQSSAVLLQKNVLATHKKICIHLSVHYVKNIFTTLPCCQTAFLCSSCLGQSCEIRLKSNFTFIKFWKMVHACVLLNIVCNKLILILSYSSYLLLQTGGALTTVYCGCSALTMDKYLTSKYPVNTKFTVISHYSIESAALKQ